MSNESENKRIDLTQFEEISEGKWEHDGGAIHAEEAERNNSIIAEYPSWNYNVKDNDGILTVEDSSNLIAMAAVPDLIAELKKCYEELDKWTNYATYIENVDMDCHKDASAEAGFLWKCTDCGAHFELPENGIYECEFGCDASE